MVRKGSERTVISLVRFDPSFQRKEFKSLKLSGHIHNSPFVEKMELHCELESALREAMLEVEQELSLPTNSFVNGSSLQHPTVKVQQMEVPLDPNFLANVPRKHLQHSKELLLRKKLAEKEKTISLLLSAAESTNVLLHNTLELLMHQ